MSKLFGCLTPLILAILMTFTMPATAAVDNDIGPLYGGDILDVTALDANFDISPRTTSEPYNMLRAENGAAAVAGETYFGLGLDHGADPPLAATLAVPWVPAAGDTTPGTAYTASAAEGGEPLPAPTQRSYS